MNDVAQAFRQAVQAHDLRATDARVVVAVSGGVDSMVLLELVARHHVAAGGTAVVAHVNYGLRGVDSDADEQCVRAAAARLGLACEVARWPGPGKGNLQDDARAFRYDFFLSVARTHGAQVVVTAHHQDDHVETVLMHLMRGAGLKGLSGIAWRSTLAHDVMLLRPLRGIARTALEDFARDERIAHRHDVTNDTCVYTRNEVRHRLIPLMEEFNPQVRSAIATMAERLRDDDATLDAFAETFCDRELRHEGSGVHIACDALNALMPALRRRVLVHAFERVAGTRARLGADHIAHMEQAAAGDDPRASYPLPYAHRFERCFGVCVLRPEA
jgi:tRNA(Ile)-lysidine synthase